MIDSGIYTRHRHKRDTLSPTVYVQVILKSYRRVLDNFNKFETHEYSLFLSISTCKQFHFSTEQQTTSSHLPDIKKVRSPGNEVGTTNNKRFYKTATNILTIASK